MDVGLEQFLMRLASGPRTKHANPHLEQIMRQERMGPVPGMLTPSALNAASFQHPMDAGSLFDASTAPIRARNAPITGSQALDGGAFATPTLGTRRNRRSQFTQGTPGTLAPGTQPLARSQIPTVPMQTQQSPARMTRQTEPMPTQQSPARMTRPTEPMPVETAAAPRGRGGRETVDIRRGNGRMTHETMAPGTLTAAPAAAAAPNVVNLPAGGGGGGGGLPRARVVPPQGSLGARAGAMAKNMGRAGLRGAGRLGKGLALGTGAAVVGGLMLQNQNDRKNYPQVYAPMSGLT